MDWYGRPPTQSPEQVFPLLFQARSLPTGFVAGSGNSLWHTKKKNSQLHRIVESVVLSYYTSDHILDILRYSEQLLFDMIRIAISFHANNKQIYIYI